MWCQISSANIFIMLDLYPLTHQQLKSHIFITPYFNNRAGHDWVIKSQYFAGEITHLYTKHNSGIGALYQ